MALDHYTWEEEDDSDFFSDEELESDFDTDFEDVDDFSGLDDEEDDFLDFDEESTVRPKARGYYRDEEEEGEWADF